MKKLFYVLPGLCFLASGAVAETIDSVSFNPARLGRYETLKVSDELTSKGGIEAQAVTVQSAGTVSVNNAGDYKFPVTEVLGAVDMKNTKFKAAVLNSYGTASFEKTGSSVLSEINQLNRNDATVEADNLNLVNVSVPSGGGELTLGENTIPEPSLICNTLDWVERVTDDNHVYEVLAFQDCTNGGCKASYSSWMNFSGTKKDTCNGMTSAAFSCVGSGKKGTCVDVYISASGVTYDNQASATYNTKDTCDGDILEKYTGEPSGSSCIDVWVDASASVVNNSASGCSMHAMVSCLTSDNSATPTTVYDNADQLAALGKEAFCKKYILKNNPSGCSDEFRISPVVNKLECPVINGTTYNSISCKATYYQRRVNKSSEKRRYRSVTCCGDE